MWGDEDALETELSYKTLYDRFFTINLSEPSAQETHEMILQQVSDIENLTQIILRLKPIFSLSKVQFIPNWTLIGM